MSLFKSNSSKLKSMLKIKRGLGFDALVATTDSDKILNGGVISVIGTAGTGKTKYCISILRNLIPFVHKGAFIDITGIGNNRDLLADSLGSVVIINVLRSFKSADFMDYIATLIKDGVKIIVIDDCWSLEDAKERLTEKCRLLAKLHGVIFIISSAEWQMHEELCEDKVLIPFVLKRSEVAGHAHVSYLLQSVKAPQGHTGRRVQTTLVKNDFCKSQKLVLVEDI
jgi:hypothetical protein